MSVHEGRVLHKSNIKVELFVKARGTPQLEYLWAGLIKNWKIFSSDPVIPTSQIVNYVT